MSINEGFIKWLGDEMTSRSWSQGEMARRSGISQSQISLLLTGRSSPGLDALQCIARAFNMRREDVFRTAGYLSPLPDHDDPAISELNYIVKHLLRADRAQLLAFARYLDKRQIAIIAAERSPGYDAGLLDRLPPRIQQPILELLKVLVDG